ncbi:MAG: hypothetical protein QG635_267 [Bacteroidota bacterium]|nr:hypothetical protein [Bacteroidota bacterium]
MTTTISKTKKLIIDKDIIDACGLEAGQEVKILYNMNRIRVIPIKKRKSLRGFLKGMENNFEREKDRI